MTAIAFTRRQRYAAASRKGARARKRQALARADERKPSETERQVAATTDALDPADYFPRFSKDRFD